MAAPFASTGFTRRARVTRNTLNQNPDDSFIKSRDVDIILDRVHQPEVPKILQAAAL